MHYSQYLADPRDVSLHKSLVSPYIYWERDFRDGVRTYVHVICTCTHARLELVPRLSALLELTCENYITAKFKTYTYMRYSGGGHIKLENVLDYKIKWGAKI